MRQGRADLRHKIRVDEQSSQHRGSLFVVEDTLGGIWSAQAAGEILRRVGFEVPVHALGQLLAVHPRLKRLLKQAFLILNIGNWIVELLPTSNLGCRCRARMHIQLFKDRF